jgi:hypothetical protein
LLREILEVKSRDHVLRYRPLRALVVACAYHARRSGNAVSKQRLVFVLEQCLLWCPLRYEIPLFKYTTWYSFNTRTIDIVIGMISMLSTTKRTNQLSILRNMLIVFRNPNNYTTASGRISLYGRISKTIRLGS